MTVYVDLHTARDTLAVGLARLVVDQLLRPREDFYSQSPELTYAQSLCLVEDMMWNFHFRLADLDAASTKEIPTPRREVPEAVRARIFARDGHQCLACGSEEHLTIDHVVPLELGGLHTEENFQALCASCNSRKGIRAIDYRLDDLVLKNGDVLLRTSVEVAQ